MRKTVLEVKNQKVAALLASEHNARTHSETQITQIADSIREFGFTNPVLVDGKNAIIAGHGRVKAAQVLGLKTVPTICIDYMTETQKRAYILADNKLALNAGWDDELLALELGDLKAAGFDLSLVGFEESELQLLLPEGGAWGESNEVGNLAERFGCPPFSVLNAREGWWQERKAEWLAKIGDNGETREGVLYKGGPPGSIAAKLRELKDGVSILDPVLSELMIKWFGLPGGVTFDPFAGDSVFGYVSASLGMRFVGIELREEQVELNRYRVKGMDATYHADTSENMDVYLADNSVDMVFSCPPYADLEVYSDDPRDVSNMTHTDFFRVYESIMSKTYKKLRDNRFAVVVIGEVRGKGGGYIGTVPKTIQIMERAGFTFYNELILVTQVATLALRAGKQMAESRKIGKTHQNILVFLKGNAKRAVADLGEIRGVVMTLGQDDE